MQKLVSIVLPVYNGEKFLAQSIESVLKQTYQTIEFIIVNDCSTDSTEDIILRYAAKDSRIRYIKNGINSKLPASLNNGFAQAMGEYYTWTSDDNMYHPDAIEKMVAYLEGHPNIALVSYDYNVIDEDGKYLGTTVVGRGDLILGNNVGACFLYRASVTEEIGNYRTDLFLVEDYDYWLRVSRRYPIEYCHEVLYEYRRHSNSLTDSRSKEVRTVLRKYQWAMLPEYESGRVQEEQLCRFYYLLADLEENRMRKRLRLIRFGLRHRKFIIWYLRKKLKSAC